MSACPSGCGRSVPVGKLLCGPCWSEVPRHIQRQVTQTWGAYRQALRRRGTPLGGSDAVRNARLAYQDARDAALGSIR